MSVTAPVEVEVDPCGRCGESHGLMRFAPLSQPLELIHPFTHWAICPATGEPLLIGARHKHGGQEQHAWTDDHGPDRLYDKFRVYRVSTGEEVTGTDEFVFVLRPERDEAAYEAMMEYAKAVAKRSPQLSKSIARRLRVIMEREIQLGKREEA